MSYLVQGIFAAAAVSLTCGAFQLASGHDLTGSIQMFSARAESGVNRDAKSDRAAVARAAMPTKTISIRPAGLIDTTVIVRIPSNREVRQSAPATLLLKSERQKPMVACEPMVSVLAPIAKRLQPGRCLT